MNSATKAFLSIVVLLSCQIALAPPFPPDFSCWQFQPESQTAFQYTRQCHGDADGYKVGMFWVQTDDLIIFQSVATHPGGDWPAYYPGSINYDARADFDRNFVVNDLDGDIIAEYINKSGSRVPADCEQKLQLQPVSGPLSAGSTYTIEWDWNFFTGSIPLPPNEDSAAGSFELSYTTDAGTGSIIATVTSTTLYEWTVPDVNSTDCAIHIKDLSHPGLTDMSGIFTMLPWTGPVIGIDPNDIYIEAQEGLDPNDQVFSVWNAGGEVLNWQITEDCNWIEVFPDSDSSTGEPNEAVLSIGTLGIGIGVYQSEITISDPNAINSPQTVQVHLTIGEGCVKPSAPFYDEWVGDNKNWDRPECWCYERQCRGDCDGTKVGLYWVQTNDLNIFISAFNKGDKKQSQATICADLDHKKVGLYRCQTDDLNEFIRLFNKGQKKLPVCPMDWDGDSDDDFNFWITP